MGFKKLFFILEVVIFFDGFFCGSGSGSGVSSFFVFYFESDYCFFMKEFVLEK